MALQQNLYIDQGTKFSTLITLYQNDGTSPLNLTGLLLELTDAATGAIKAGRYLYDVEMVLSGIKTRPIEGIVIVSPQITQI